MGCGNKCWNANQINNDSIQERNELLQIIHDMNSLTFRAKIINFAKTIQVKK